jgi:hypothetical protein
MNARVLGLGVVFVAFAIFTAEAFVQMGSSASSPRASNLATMHGSSPIS